MLNIYYGRENIDKEQFIYQTIQAQGFAPARPVLVIVPDQYTLEAERKAFQVLKRKSLMGLDVYSLSRLGHNILAEVGGSKQTFIDKYGRQMLLTRIARQEEEHLQVYQGSQNKSSFIEMVNNFISELKQYGIKPEDLQAVCDSVPEEELLHRKLSDLLLLYSRYQEGIAGKYTDSEDYIDLYMHRLGDSRLVKGARIWVYGFDSFAPKSMQVLQGLMQVAEEVNVVLTYDTQCRDEELFSLTGLVQHHLLGAAREVGCPVGEVRKLTKHDVEARLATDSDGASRLVTDSDDQRRLAMDSNGSKRPAIAALEQNLFAVAPEPCHETEGITIVEAANFHSEAESAAAYVLHLLRDKGYRLRDIVLICNDQQTRGNILARVFEEYGIPLFHDNKRGIESHSLSVFLVALLETVANRYRTQDFIRMLKSGFTSLDMETVDELENYARNYRIKGTMWKRPFTVGLMEYGQEGLAALEEHRQAAVEITEGLEAIAAQSQTTGDFVRKFYEYLTETLALGDRIAVLLESQRREGFETFAQETEQIFAMILGILDQIVELIGEDPFDLAEFLEIFQFGIRQIEVGVLPASLDDLMMGTMQRTRSGSIRALVIVGANDGILPATKEDDGLFALDEMDRLAAEGHVIGKLDQIRVQEERLAIYRNLAKPTEALWISYSTGDADGKEIRPSEIIEQIQGILPEVSIQPDLVNAAFVDSAETLREQEMSPIGGERSTLRHLAEELRNQKAGIPLSQTWKAVERWMRTERPDSMERMDVALSFQNKPKALHQDFDSLLFTKDEGGTKSLSPSRLEKYAQCPFSYYVQYGLRPKEMRTFEVARREVGDVYHHCLMKMSRQLTMANLWNTIDYDTCRQMIRKVISEETSEYRDGLFHYGKEEGYKASRIEQTCVKTMWALIEHVRAGSVKSGRYEIGFSHRQGAPLKPIAVKTPAGDTIYVEGTIDRLDTLENGRLKVIDYKSGNLTLKEEEIESGYRLQLMVYMTAAMGDTEIEAWSEEDTADGSAAEEPAEAVSFNADQAASDSATSDAKDSAATSSALLPGGVFYFHIQDPRVKGISADADESVIMEKVQEALQEAFQLNGILVNDPETIREIAGEIEAQSKSSVISLKRQKNGTLNMTGDSMLVSDEEFFTLQSVAKKKISEIVSSMEKGNIPIHPMEIDSSKKACEYCDFKGICRFDLGFDGCEYNVVDEKK